MLEINKQEVGSSQDRNLQWTVQHIETSAYIDVPCRIQTQTSKTARVLRGEYDQLKMNAIKNNDSWLTQQLNNRNDVTDISFQQTKSTCVRPPIK